MGTQCTVESGGPPKTTEKGNGAPVSDGCCCCCHYYHYYSYSYYVTLSLNPQIHVPKTVYTLAPKFLYRDYMKVQIDTIWVHGALHTLNVLVLLQNV